MGGSGSKFNNEPLRYTIPGTVYKGDYHEFMNANADNPQFHEYYEKHHSLKDLYDEAQKVRFRELQDRELSLNPLSTDEAYDVIDTVEGTYQWFTNEDSAVKPKLYRQIMEREDVLHAAWSMAYNNYRNQMSISGGKPLSYGTWLKTPTTVYRGGNQKFIDSDLFVSYSSSEKVAQKFDALRGNNGVKSMRIRPIDTYGQYSNIGELEYLIPISKLKK